MSTSATFLMIAVMGAVAWLVGRQRARSFGASDKFLRLPALPSHHASYLAMCTAGPAALFAVVWSFLSDSFVLRAVMTQPVAHQLPLSPLDRDAVLSEARGLADGSIEAAFNPLSNELAKPIAEITAHYAMIGTGLLLTVAIIGFCIGFLKIKPAFRARQRVEGVVMLCLMLASLVALATTFGIVASLVFETSRFFALVPVSEFLFGTHWAPSGDVVAGQDNGFGAVPLFWGTIFIGAVIAMIVAVPTGVLTAIYLTQYAPARLRTWLKPALEMLAGIPTVVYGYFAALTLGPVVREWALGLGIENPTSESALTAGLVMGVMIIPLISSMADDSITAVPQSMRDGSLAMGATTSETIRHVLIPAALPGVVGGVLLAVSRAIGETMIVVMAAGLAANLTLNPFSSVTTVTTQIVQLLTGDQEFDSAKTLAAFALGLALFIVTLLLNIYALRIVKKYREAYD